MLPSHVKVFWVLSVAIVAYWTLSAEWHVTFLSGHELAVLQRLPPAIGETIMRVGIIVSMTATFFWGALTLGTAWFAAFRRRNWGRWSFAGVFVIREVLPPCIILAEIFLTRNDSGVYQLALWRAFWKSTAREWGDPYTYIIPMLTIAAIVAIFSGNANGWFRQPAGERKGT